MLSIVIVNYNAGEFLKACIESVYKETKDVSFDIWVVENNSFDNSIKTIKNCFPDVHIIENTRNVGFAKANNMAISKTSADYILMLNPDTLIKRNAIGKTVKFMEENPKIGIAGCKVLNEDGTLQLACRRSIPTPKIAFWRLTGLSFLFPKSEAMARYNLTYLDPDKPHEVDAVSGAFLMIRKEVIDDIGVLDENFFMYGEELDWCFRATKAGWLVMYYPSAKIIHYKGGCSKFNSRKATLEFYRAMYLFHKKHFAKRHSTIINYIIYTGIFLKAIGSWKSLLFFTKVGSKK
ncbi:MAG: glycosyltransferase family 2 protein [Planctomycetes bacterium]|nr:glycosyltransferase family 2 protein [Planctomycetota bacterium]